MSSGRLLLAFSSELVLFVVAAGGIAILFLERTMRPRARLLGAAGMASLAVAAFLRGADVVVAEAEALAVLRGAGFLLFGLSALTQGPRRAPDEIVEPLLVAPALMGSAAAAVVGAAAALFRRGARFTSVALLTFAGSEFLRSSSSAASGDVVQIVAAVLLGVALFRSAVSSVAGRFVVASAALLALLVVALSIVLSVLVTNRLTDEAIDRAGVQVAAELQELERLKGRAQRGALTVSAVLRSPDVATGVRMGNEGTATAVVSTGVQLLGEGSREADFVALVKYVGNLDAGLVLEALAIEPRSDGLPGVEGVPLLASERAALAASPIVLSALARENANGLQPLGGDAILVLGAVTFAPDPAPEPAVAATVTGFRLNRVLLSGLEGGDVSRTTYLVTQTGAFASRGGAPALPEGTVTELRENVVVGGRTVRTQTAEGDNTRYLAAEPLLDPSGRQIAALVVTSPGDSVVATRRTIFRALFATALGGVLVALALTAFAGARITAPLRVLTSAARRVRGGDLSARSDVRTRDEVGALGVAFDAMTESLEEQAAALSAAAAEEARLRRQVEGTMMSMIDGVVAVDLEGRVSAVNRAAEELVGLPASALLAAPVDEVLLGVDAEGISLERRLARGGSPWSARVMLSRADGSSVPVILGRSSITDDAGKVLGDVLVLSDVSEEEALERMKTDFLSNISHELRTPLTPIKGYTSLLQRTPKLTAKQRREFLAEIVKSSTRLERIVGILVDFAALEAGRFETRNEAVDVGELVEQVAAKWNGQSPEHRVSVSRGEGVPQVLGDRSVLSRALLELLDNAVKYSPDGGKVEIRASALDGSAVIEVVDEGIGFDEARLDELMQEFRQADASSTRRFGGLGLGLPFVKRIAEAHGGRLTATSREGQGSVFAVHLPRAPR